MFLPWVEAIVSAGDKGGARRTQRRHPGTQHLKGDVQDVLGGRWEGEEATGGRRSGQKAQGG